MKLTADHSFSARTVYVQCCQCGRRVKFANAYSDLDGKAFYSYYCKTCACEQVDKLPTCNDANCIICHEVQDT